MKKKKTVTKKRRTPKLPKFNGRPQVWLSEGDRLRVVQSNGDVRYGYIEVEDGRFHYVDEVGCTSRDTQRRAVKAILKYAKEYSLPRPKFVGYL
jgi:hypothetical protein